MVPGYSMFFRVVSRGLFRFPARGSWLRGKHRPTHPVSASWGTSTVVLDILIHFRRLDQARSSGSRGGHQRTGGRPAWNIRRLSLSFSLFTSSYPLNRWRIGSNSKSSVIHRSIPCVWLYYTRSVTSWLRRNNYLLLIGKAGFSSPLFPRSLSSFALPLLHRPWRSIRCQIIYLLGNE